MLIVHYLIAEKLVKYINNYKTNIFDTKLNEYFQTSNHFNVECTFLMSQVYTYTKVKHGM